MINDFFLSQEYVRFVYPLDREEHASEMRRIKRRRLFRRTRETKPEKLVTAGPEREPENPALGYF